MRIHTPLKTFLRCQEREYLVELITAHRDMVVAASVAGVSLASLYRKVRTLGVYLPRIEAPKRLAVVRSALRPPAAPKTPITMSLLRYFGCRFSRREWRTLKHDTLRLAWLYHDAKHGHRRLVRHYHAHSVNGEIYQINEFWRLLKKQLKAKGVAT